ncbi:MAG TPA: recombinase-like helix-turn-helix domain-containing protein [Hyphomicrobiales bacterium]|nr:recombinase-like helix-turn-helix domain-containing protein [Hyphomicrobiales bacterium]
MALDTTRTHEDLLGEMLEQLPGKGCEDLGDFVVGLNELNVHGPAGQERTEELLRFELERLGAWARPR